MQAESANYPFCTIEPNTASVSIPDDRLNKLGKLASSQKVVGAQVKFVDVAGLVRGASSGAGLGNKFLENIRNVDVILNVVRCFDDANIGHVEESVDPVRDISIIANELMFSDLEQVENRIKKGQAKLKAQNNETNRRDVEILERCLKLLSDGRLISTGNFSRDESKVIDSFHLLTSKPLAYVLNVDEASVASGNHHTAAVEASLRKQFGDAQSNLMSVRVCSVLEESCVNMGEEARAELLELADVKESGLQKVARLASRLLDVECYYTVGEKESRSWLIPRGSTAQESAGKIHSDMSRGFIAAEIIAYNDFVTAGGEKQAKQAGKCTTQGKTYIVKDGDICVFRFNV